MKQRKHEEDYVKLASFLYTKRFREEFGHDVSGVLFNKYLTLLNYESKEKRNIDIGLAHCWYRWGDVVVRQSLPYTRWTHSDLNLTQVTFTGKEPDPVAGDPVFGHITEFTEQFIRRYRDDREGVESAVDDIYTRAPLDFQRDYKKFRESLKISRENIPYDNVNDYLRGLFATAMDSFPQGFRNIRGQKNAFSAVFAYAIDNNVPADDLFDIAEDFWFFFCYHLRVRYNENVAPSIIDGWKNSLDLETRRYDASIQNYAYEFCRDSRNPVIQGLIESRAERLNELDALMKGLDW